MWSDGASGITIECDNHPTIADPSMFRATMTIPDNAKTILATGIWVLDVSYIGLVKDEAAIQIKSVSLNGKEFHVNVPLRNIGLPRIYWHLQKIMQNRNPQLMIIQPVIDVQEEIHFTISEHPDINSFSWFRTNLIIPDNINTCVKSGIWELDVSYLYTANSTCFVSTVAANHNDADLTSWLDSQRNLPLRELGMPKVQDKLQKIMYAREQVAIANSS